MHMTLLAILATGVLAASAAVVHAEEAGDSESGPAVERPDLPDVAPPAPPKPALALDRLLRPPSALPKPEAPRQHGGKSEREWVETFQAARGEVTDLDARVVEAQARLRDASSGAWGYSPVGSGQPSDPEVLKLSARLKRDRQSLEAAERRLRDLEVEASLAGVPEAWRSR